MSNEQENVLKELLECIGRKIETWLLEPKGKTIMDLEYGAARVERVDCGANPRVEFSVLSVFSLECLSYANLH